jgi:hypothetical protein
MSNHHFGMLIEGRLANFFINIKSGIVFVASGDGFQNLRTSSKCNFSFLLWRNAY